MPAARQRCRRRARRLRSCRGLGLGPRTQITQILLDGDSTGITGLWLPSVHSNGRQRNSTPLAEKASDSSGNSSAVSSPQRRRLDGSGANGDARPSRSAHLHNSGNSSGNSGAVSSPQRRRLDGSGGAHGGAPNKNEAHSAIPKHQLCRDHMAHYVQ